MYVCHCRAVTDRTITAVIDSGAATVDEITERCQAGSQCGGCWETLQALLDESARLRPVDATAAA